MNFCAVICEFNPFHNGHAKIIAKAKELTGLPVLCLMSGDFCQRGEPAILNKKLRAQHAIEAGADVVFQLPVCYSIEGADIFAKGAIEVLKGLPVSHLIFGSECGDLLVLQKAKDLLFELENSQLVKSGLKEGLSFKSAIEKAAAATNPVVSEVLLRPNNMLAVAYLKALDGSNIVPLTIKREDNFLSTNTTGNLCSASAIRNAICNKKDVGTAAVPGFVRADFDKAKDFAKIKEHLFFALLRSSAKTISELPSCGEGLENRVVKIAHEVNSYDEFVEKATTKRYNKMRIARLVLENFLGTTKLQLNEILGNTQTTMLLAKTKELNFDGFFDKKINLILKKSDRKKYQNQLSLQKDILAELLYSR